MLHGRTGRWISIAIIVIVGFAVYANSLRGPFIFDDIISIVESPNIRSLWPPSQSFSAGEGSGASGRPLVAFSLALNYAWGELDVFGYHLFNVTVHVLTALALFGFVRRALLHTRVRDEALWFALGTTLVWLVHPLNTDALNHVITRHEILLAGLYLFCLYAAERAFTAERGKPWATLCVIACAGAMMSKEIAVSAPLLVLFYDRNFISGDFRSALARHRALHIALAATLICLALSIASGDRGSTVGFGRDISSLDYLRTQAQGIVHYLRLSFFPSGLALDYSGWAPVRNWGPALLPGLFVVALFGVTCVALWRKRAEGFAGLLFFAVLAPSSSFIPLTGEWIAEHRMYLPLSALVAVVVPWSFVLCRRFAAKRAGIAQAALLLAVCTPLAWATVERNQDYGTAPGIWRDVLDEYPGNARAHDHLAALLLEQGQLQAALRHGEEALRLDPKLDTVNYNLGTILMQLGQPTRALEQFRTAEGFKPQNARLQGNFGVVLGQTGATEEAILHLRRAIDLDSDYLTPHRNLAILLVGLGRTREALPHLQRVLQGQADAQILEMTARLLATDPDPAVRNGAEALRMAESLLAGGSANPRWYDVLAAAYAENGRFDEARQTAERALAEARRRGMHEFAAEVEARLEFYRRDQPYHTPRKP